jgi:hypothetical protein
MTSGYIDMVVDETIIKIKALTLKEKKILKYFWYILNIHLPLFYK